MKKSFKRSYTPYFYVMFPIFPVVGPTAAGLKIIWGAVTGEVSSLITKNIAKTIWGIIKFIFKLVFIIVISFFEAVTLDFFNNMVKYWRKDF